MVAAALIPFFSGLKFPHFAFVVGVLGVLITILEGILQLNQYQQIWTMYRATSEALTHEKYLFLALRDLTPWLGRIRALFWPSVLRR